MLRISCKLCPLAITPLQQTQKVTSHWVWKASCYQVGVTETLTLVCTKGGSSNFKIWGLVRSLQVTGVVPLQRIMVPKHLLKRLLHFLTMRCMVFSCMQHATVCYHRPKSKGRWMVNWRHENGKPAKTFSFYKLSFIFVRTIGRKLDWL